jgi:hypothetical protein
MNATTATGTATLDAALRAERGLEIAPCEKPPHDGGPGPVERAPRVEPQAAIRTGPSMPDRPAPMQHSQPPRKPT